MDVKIGSWLFPKPRFMFLSHNFSIMLIHRINWMSEETKLQSLVQINDRFITKSPPALTRLDKKVHVSVRVLVELVRKLQNKR